LPLWKECARIQSLRYETLLSEGIDKTTSTHLRANFTDKPHIFAKLNYPAKKYKGKPFHNKFLSEQKNAVPLFNIDTNMSRRY
jgi:hypothetical protein